MSGVAIDKAFSYEAFSYKTEEYDQMLSPYEDECWTIVYGRDFFGDNKITLPSLRLIVTELCNRRCAYCANNGYENIETIQFNEIKNYGEVVLTGGEPFLKPDVVSKIVQEHYQTLDLYLYTQMIPSQLYESVLLQLNGVTVTIHDESAAHLIDYYENFITAYGHENPDCNWRLCLMPGVYDMPYTPSLWSEVRKVEILDYCPYPEDELRKL
jgi:hypothetical protein